MMCTQTPSEHKTASVGVGGRGDRELINSRGTQEIKGFLTTYDLFGSQNYTRHLMISGLIIFEWLYMYMYMYCLYLYMYVKL